MRFESVVLLAAEPFSIYLGFLESLTALGRAHQSLTFGIKEDRDAQFSGIAVDLPLHEERRRTRRKRRVEMKRATTRKLKTN